MFKERRTQREGGQAHKKTDQQRTAESMPTDRGKPQGKGGLVMPRRALPMQMAPKSQTSGHHHKRKPKKAVGTHESGFVVHEGYFLCVVGLDAAEDWTVLMDVEGA